MDSAHFRPYPTVSEAAVSNQGKGKREERLEPLAPGKSKAIRAANPVPTRNHGSRITSRVSTMLQQGVAADIVSISDWLLTVDTTAYNTTQKPCRTLTYTSVQCTVRTVERAR